MGRRRDASTANRASHGQPRCHGIMRFRRKMRRRKGIHSIPCSSRLSAAILFPQPLPDISRALATQRPLHLVTLERGSKSQKRRNNDPAGGAGRGEISSAAAQPKWRLPLEPTSSSFFCLTSYGTILPLPQCPTRRTIYVTIRGPGVSGSDGSHYREREFFQGILSLPAWRP